MLPGFGCAAIIAASRAGPAIPVPRLDKIFASNAFFARKFEAGSPVLDRIEERLASWDGPLRDGPETSTADA